MTDPTTEPPEFQTYCPSCGSEAERTTAKVIGHGGDTPHTVYSCSDCHLDEFIVLSPP